MTAFKAQASMREYKQQLKLSVAVAFVDSIDANQYPSVRMTGPSSEIIWAHIETFGNADRVNSVGLAQPSYSPHKIQLLLDADTINNLAFRYRAIAEAARLGMKTEIYQINSLPSVWDLTGATLVATINPDPINKLTNVQ